MLTGLKGVKYGLQQPAKAKGQQPTRRPLAAFADDEPEEDRQGVGRAIARQAAVKTNDKKVFSRSATFETSRRTIQAVAVSS